MKKNLHLYLLVSADNLAHLGHLVYSSTYVLGRVVGGSRNLLTLYVSHNGAAMIGFNFIYSSLFSIYMYTLSFCVYGF